MAKPCKVYSDDISVRQQLEILDLEIGWLNDVIRHIALTINSQTADHPNWGVGITTASEAVFAIRSILKPHGWFKEEEKGFALTAHPSNLLAINLAKGDENTGNSEKEVLSVSDKGICTELAVEINSQLDMFATSREAIAEEEIERSRRPTWYLIYSNRDGAIYAELSLPIALNETGKLSGWSKRILLPVTRLDGDVQLTAGFDDGGFEVNIKRKQGQ